MLNSHLIILFIVASLFVACNCWGFAGHQLTAAVAENFLKPTTLRKISKILGRKNLTTIATWADEIKRSPKYRFTSGLHYVNPQDDEPSSCTFNYSRDCGNEKCIVGAIFNYTRRLFPSANLPLEDQDEALKFIVHFTGDIHQPLHVSGRGKGGNEASVRFLGVRSNLHSVWDSSILMKRIKEDFGGNFAKFLTYLVEKINGEWKEESKHWTECHLGKDLSSEPQSYLQKVFGLFEKILPFKFVSTNPICPDIWAEETNKINCESVWPGYDNPATEAVELGMDYYHQSVPVVEKSIAQGGIRMAAILDFILSQ